MVAEERPASDTAIDTGSGPPAPAGIPDDVLAEMRGRAGDSGTVDLPDLLSAYEDFAPEQLRGLLMALEMMGVDVRADASLVRDGGRPDAPLAQPDPDPDPDPAAATGAVGAAASEETEADATPRPDLDAGATGSSEDPVRIYLQEI
ncbi:MAG: hypothetical protein K1X95_16580, partial [Acidimicrobiia bacterium]|nr:hypothetical protein [Acidimicrobiia bacterium]